MDHGEIRAIRGALTRKAFARLLGVSPLTVLRWELPDANKEARRPRLPMIEKLRALAVEGVGLRGGGPAEDDDEDGEASEPVDRPSPSGPATFAADLAFARDERRVQPLLDRLATESWAWAEDELLGLLSSDTLETPGGQALASIGCAQVQLIGRLDGRATFATLSPILRDVERGDLPRPVAARAHVIAAFLFALLDSRFFDPGRVNAHAARAEELLGEADDDLRVLLARARVAAMRFADPHMALRAYQAGAPVLDRATSPLARFIASGLRGFAAHVTGDAEGVARHARLDLTVTARLGLNGMMVVLVADRVQRMVRGAYRPEAILEFTRLGRQTAEAGRVTLTEPFLVVLAAEIEALYRAGRLKEAAAVADEAMRIGHDAGIARYALAVPIARMYIFASRVPELGALADTLEAENAGTHRGLPNVHALHVRAMAIGLAGDLEGAAELVERVCAAPETTIGIQYLTHDAHAELAYLKLLLHDLDGAEAALRRGEALLKKRPSVWYSAFFTRLRGYLLLQRGRFAEARQKFEVALATFAMTGDVAHQAYSKGLLDTAARAASHHDPAQIIADVQAILDRHKVAPELGRRILDLCVPMANGEWHEPTLTERLAVAVDRLSVQGLRPDVLPGELASILAAIFPGHEPIVGREPSADPADEIVELDREVGGLWIGVRGALAAEQRAALRLLATVAPLAMRGSRVVVDPEVAVDAVLPAFIAAAPATRRLKAEVVQIARSSSTILVHGESGTGKEVVARAVHELSSRADRAYIVFNCASVPRELFESQLFGHRRGSFTGAVADSPGVIRAADGGTLFLDEIGELPLDMQPKLLRFLENGEVLPVGEAKARRVDVRIVAATHRDLALQVRAGVFREDLFYRLNVVPLRVPPLRERGEDVLVLARFFMTRLAPEGSEPPELASDAIAALKTHAWPGNVRELRNVLERAMAYAPIPRVLHAEHLRIAG
jgi:tetratricopeptide (TPR) repeat protein